MLSTVLKHIFGTRKEREVKRVLPLVREIRRLEPRCVAMSNEELRTQTGLLKERLAQGATMDDILPEAFAVVSEAAKRLTGMRPFDVQLMGGVILHEGKIAEMVTGEGKTLVATMPIYLNALTGRGVHLITVNDYLARRDREWMGPIYEFLGLTVGLIQEGMGPAERQVGYRADITYGTNNEFGFDYLRDNMALRPEERVQRELTYAIIDEVDSILIDEARTPLIISGRPGKDTDLYYTVENVVRRLRKDTHYELEEKGHHVLLSDEGMEAAEQMLGIENLYSDEHLGTVHMLQQAIRAKHFFKRDVEYVVRDGQVQIVDEFTGRILEGRRYRDGMHQAIEAKENVPVQFESQTIASVTYQNYFRLYDKIAGMTGTALTEAHEFAQIYDLDVVQIPTNLPLIRDDHTDLVFMSEEGKFKYVVREIERIHDSGRPILVGTVSIEKSERVAGMLGERGISDFEVLNAKYHAREAAIVANAGKPGAITIATNMAGRGTDIKLSEGVRDLGGLAIVGTERHESRRIDNQLRGRCGRQGDPGSTRFYVSLEDEVARLFAGEKAKKFINMLGGKYLDDEPLNQRMVSRTIERAQRQVEEYNFEIRKHLKEYDDVMDRQRRIVYAIRRDVLEDRDVTDRLREVFRNLVQEMVDEYAPESVLPEEWDLEGLATRFRHVFNFEPDMAGDAARADREPSRLVETLEEAVLAEYARREKAIEEELRAQFRQEIGGDESRVDFAALARKYVHNFELMAFLSAADEKWIDHLRSMDYLRDSVRLRAYGQRDPLVEYKKEGFEMFQSMMAAIEENVVQLLFRVTDPEIRRNREMQLGRGNLTARNDPLSGLAEYSYVGADKRQDRSFASYDTSRFALAGQQNDPRSAQAAQGGGAAGQGPRPKPRPRTVRHVGERVGRNDPCPCGSGKKYKKCCGARVEEDIS